MSLICWIGGSVWFSFPCVSGDEPLIVAAYDARVPWADICLATGSTRQAAYNAYQRAIKRRTRE